MGDLIGNKKKFGGGGVGWGGSKGWGGWGVGRVVDFIPSPHLYIVNSKYKLYVINSYYSTT